MVRMLVRNGTHGCRARPAVAVTSRVRDARHGGSAGKWDSRCYPTSPLRVMVSSWGGTKLPTRWTLHPSIDCSAVRKQPCALPRVEVSGFGRRLERRKERRERGRMGVPRSLRSAVPVPRQQREEVKIHRIGSQGIGPLSCNHGASPACASRESNTPLSRTSRRVGAP